MKVINKLIVGSILSVMAWHQNAVAQSTGTTGFWDLKGNAGTDPSINFIGTTDNKALKIKTNNAVRITVNGSGKVGIGNTAPVFKLDVKGGSINTDSVYRITSVQVLKRDASNRVQLGDSLANVGVGTEIPIHARLEIKGGIGAAVAMFGADKTGVTIQADNPEIGFNYFYNGGTKTIKAGRAAVIGMSPANGDVYVGNFNGNQSSSDFGAITGYQNAITIKQNGNVGIGTSSPTHKLSVAGFADFSSVIINNGSLLESDGTDLYLQGNLPSNTSGNPAGNVILSTASGLLGGNFKKGKVGIGTTTPAYTLDVCGTIRGKEVRVETGWCDYVFDNDYQLRSLSEVESYIKINKHLPDVTPGRIIESEGLELGKFSAQMIKKIEELTLYIIEQEKAINNLKASNDKLESTINSLTDKGGN